VVGRGGTFRPSLNGSWSPIRGEQHFTADPPGFIWWGRVRMFPGLWIDARDPSANGIGNMFVTMESTFTIADSRGPQLDEGALMCLLGELTWLPTAFLDGRYVQWSALDEHRATATLQVNDRWATAAFEFRPDGLPAAFLAERYYDDGGGKGVMTPWVGRFSDYRSVDGVLVPTRSWLRGSSTGFRSSTSDLRSSSLNSTPTHRFDAAPRVARSYHEARRL
jgi:hypothetical protein